MAGERKPVKYQIIDSILQFEPDAKGWQKEVNIMIWGNGKTPVIDIRKWNREQDMSGKGISLLKLI